jgi:Protein of unknown function (DUF1488)
MANSGLRGPGREISITKVQRSPSAPSIFLKYMPLSVSSVTPSSDLFRAGAAYRVENQQRGNRDSKQRRTFATRFDDCSSGAFCDYGVPRKRKWRGRSGSMPLTRGRIVGYDSKRLAFGFTMLNDGETVQCQISDAAMDELAGVKGTERLARQAQFLALRGRIEQIASELFDASPAIKGYVIRIFTKHVRK